MKARRIPLSFFDQVCPPRGYARVLTRHDFEADDPVHGAP